jgi:hypothetical protein
MTRIREVLVDWTAAGNAGGVSVFHCPEAGDTIANNRLHLYTFLKALDAVFASGTSWVIRTDGKVLDDATGSLVDKWTEGTARTSTGSSGTAVVANASQVLVRFNTSSIINGRFLTGRVYLPGASTTVLSNGQVASGTQTTINAAAATFVATTSSYGVWHRPTGGSGGVIHPMTSASTWAELATLRKRRQ